MGLFQKILGTPTDRELKKIKPTVDAVLSLESTYEKMSDAELRGMTGKLRARLAAGETTDDILPDAFAVCREAAWRVLKMKHFPVQVIGGVVLHNGDIAEMKTGEGKTLVATLPCYLNALSGEGVHVVTVNEYLARRDSEWMGKVYNFLGLSVGLIVPGLDHAQRKQGYDADITYGTNNEFGFDYLRDNMVRDLKSKVQRGHAFAVVDEVDSILVDEARTPLIISGPGEKSTDLYKRADNFARTLQPIKVTEVDDKTELEELGGDYIVDEKARSVSLTQSGIEKAQRFFNVKNLADPENMTLSHHINQAIRARGLMTCDVDYVVKNGEVIIVDEFTGRLMIGRRYSDGLHQAIEAKENVTVARENKTLATITFQNYFRMYKKLAGMTGTAITEAAEFLEIYGLDVIEIPTNKPMVREDLDDVVYQTAKGKYRAVIENIIECHKRGQPVLVGTVSVEKSETLSRMLKNKGIKHEVLNAKHHEKEALIVAQAGGPGAVTIATNMAGRGTDIMLGGNPEFLARNDMLKEGYDEQQLTDASGYSETDDPELNALREHFRALIDKRRAEIVPAAEQVKAAGGLFIIGTERHESRRIDNQLRGRSGRQGDPGQTRFYLSLDDDLMRLFGGERMGSIMSTLKVEEDMPIEHKMMTGIIESAQKKLEARNFSIRKNVLNYDDVMNAQRETIYSQRDMVLEGRDIKEKIIEMIDESITGNVSLYLSASVPAEEWNLAGLRSHYYGWLCSERDFRYDEAALKKLQSADVVELLSERAHKIYEDKENRLGAEKMRLLERLVMLRVVDSHWMDHIDAMDELRQGIGLRGFAQKDPVVEYRIEGYNMFDAMIESIREDTAKYMLTAEIVNAEQRAKQQSERITAAAAGVSAAQKKPQKADKKPGRNDPCPCGSGLKYKKCCGRNDK